MGFEIAKTMISIQVDGSQIRSGFARQKGPTNRAASKLGTVTGQAFSKAFGAAGVIGVALAFQKIANMGEQFNRKMRNSLAIMGDVSTALRVDMRNAALEAARTTQFSSAQAAESFFYLASAGLDAKQSIVAMPQVAAFAQAGMFDLSRATDLATDAQSALGLTVKDAQQNLTNMRRVTDVLVKGNTLANASVEQLSQSMTTKAGAAAKIAGMEIEELTSLLLALADQGVKSHDAGTAVNIILRDLKTKAIENSKAFEEMNIAVFNSAGAMNNIADIIADVEKALAGQSAEQKNVILSQLGFVDKSKIFIQSIVGTSEKMREFQKELVKAGGMTQEVANKQLTPFQKAVAKIGVEFTKLGTSIINGLTPVISLIGNNISMIIKLGAALVAAVSAWALMSFWIAKVKILQIAYNAVLVTTTILAHIMTGTLPVGFAKVAIAVGAGIVAFAGMSAALGNVGGSVEEVRTEVDKLNDSNKTLFDSTQEGKDTFIEWSREANRAAAETKKLREEREKLEKERQEKESPKNVSEYLAEVEKVNKEMTEQRNKARERKENPEFVKWNKEVDWDEFERNRTKVFAPYVKNLREAREAQKELRAILIDTKGPNQDFFELQRKINSIMERNPKLYNIANQVLGNARDELIGYTDRLQGLREEYAKLASGMKDNEFQTRKYIETQMKLGLITQKEAFLLLMQSKALDNLITKQDEQEKKKQKREQEKQQIQQSAKQLLEFSRTGPETTLAKILEIEKLASDPRSGITQRIRNKALRKIKEEVTPESKMSGRFGFAAFSSTIQDALLKDDIGKKSLLEQKQTNMVLKVIEGLLSKPIQVKGVGLPEAAAGVN